VEIGATEYREAASEHLGAAIHCHFQGSYLTCHYLCGLAVECILRAYRWKIDPLWDGRHILPILFKESQLDSHLSADEAETVSASFIIVSVRWSNSHRFTSPSKLAKYLNQIGATRNIRGDKLKANSMEIVSSGRVYRCYWKCPMEKLTEAEVKEALHGWLGPDAVIDISRDRPEGRITGWITHPSFAGVEPTERQSWLWNGQGEQGDLPPWPGLRQTFNQRSSQIGMLFTFSPIEYQNAFDESA
jgi:hypothetical protein